MGVYIDLKVLGQHISDEEWAAVYDETLTLLKARDAIGPKRETVKLGGLAAVERVCYSRDIENDADNPKERHWHVVGDTERLETGESFLLHRSRERWGDYQSPDGVVDIIAELIKETENGDRGDYHQVFNDKTQGYPYHYTILAAGMLVEDRFPKLAVVSGNIDRYQAIKSREIIKEVLGREVALPVVTEPERLIDRISEFRAGAEAIEAFSCIIRDDPRRDAEERMQAITGKFDTESLHQWMLNDLNHYTSPGQKGSLDIFTDWLNAGFDLKTLATLACVREDGPRFDPEAFVGALVKSLWLTIELEERKHFEMFQKPKGGVDGVHSQFGLVMFATMGIAGRDLRVHMPEEDMIAVMAELFPDKAETFREKATKGREGIPEILEAFKQYTHRLDSDDDAVKERLSLADGTEFFYLEEGGPLTESQEVFLMGIASMVNKLDTELREGGSEEMKRILITEPDINRSLATLIHLTGRRGPRLTEDAWKWIDREEDFRLMRTLVFLAVIDEHEQKFYNTKKCIFEKRWLCELVTGWSEDPKKIASLREMAKEYQNGDASS